MLLVKSKMIIYHKAENKQKEVIKVFKFNYQNIQSQWKRHHPTSGGEFLSKEDKDKRKLINCSP